MAEAQVAFWKCIGDRRAQPMGVRQSKEGDSGAARTHREWMGKERRDLHPFPARGGP